MNCPQPATRSLGLLLRPLLFAAPRQGITSRCLVGPQMHSMAAKIHVCCPGMPQTNSNAPSGFACNLLNTSLAHHTQPQAPRQQNTTPALHSIRAQRCSNYNSLFLHQCPQMCIPARVIRSGSGNQSSAFLPVTPLRTKNALVDMFAIGM